MKLGLHNLQKISGNKSKGKRVGRGYGSGVGGHTTRRGQKGTGARNTLRLGFEGGRTPLYRRVPHWRGLRNIRAGEKPEVVSLDKLNVFKKGDEVTPDSLKAHNIIKGKSSAGVKILNTGTVTKAVTVSGCKISATAKSAIKQAGGSVSPAPRKPKGN